MADMKRFFDDYLNPKKILELKDEYKKLNERAAVLPLDYECAFNQMSQYMWMYAKGNGSDMLRIQEGLLDTFEKAVADDMPVLDVTGEDVAAYADSLLKGNGIAPYDPRQRLNEEIHEPRMAEEAAMELRDVSRTSMEIRARYHELEEQLHGSAWSVEEDALAFLTDAGLVGRLAMDNQGRWPSADKEMLPSKIGECVWWLAVLSERMGLSFENCVEQFLDERLNALKR